MSARKYNSRRPARRSQGALLSKVAVFAVMLLVLGLAVYAFRRCEDEQSVRPVHIDDPEALTHVRMPDGTPQTMVDYEGFTVSFNPELHVPNYVVWELTAEESEAAEVTRNESQFAPDENVAGCASPSDYKGSGFDRGHMVPAADMKWSRRAMDDCHLMTNIVPQTHRLNSGPWQTVEKNCRKWALRDSALVIICGPILTDRLTEHIGENNVVVPERFFKVILAPYANPPRGIAFIMNNYEVSGGAQPYTATIDEVEAATGMDFFSALPDDVEASVESQANYQLWQRLRER